MSQQPSLFQSVYPNLTSVASLPLFDLPLNQYPLVQYAHVHDSTNHLSNLLSPLDRSNIASPLNDLSLHVQRASIAQLHCINNALGHFPFRDVASIHSERHDFFDLTKTPSIAQALSAVSHPVRPDISLHSQTRDHEKHNAVRLTLYIASDDGKLNKNQIFLRQNIELFRATEKDILSLTRGKNKPIVLHQVGIRCCHCSHVPVGRRKKGSTYFPSNLIGLYQAAQNLSVEHLQSGLCTELPPDVRERFAEFASGKKCGVSGAGKKYWAEAGRRMGLIDTDDGIRFAWDRVDDRQTRESADYKDLL